MGPCFCSLFSFFVVLVYYGLSLIHLKKKLKWHAGTFNRLIWGTKRMLVFDVLYDIRIDGRVGKTQYTPSTHIWFQRTRQIVYEILVFQKGISRLVFELASVSAMLTSPFMETLEKGRTLLNGRHSTWLECTGYLIFLIRLLCLRQTAANCSLL